MRPGVLYLDSHGFQVTLASRTLAKAEAITKDTKAGVAKQLDVETDEGKALLEELVPQMDAVLSLLPYVFHVQVAKVAIKHKVNFFTTSYVSDAMRALKDDAIAAGVILLNECGVDPGTDHMSAMRQIHEVQKKGGKVRSFTSFCGGLPRPEDNDNPYGYKFSWAPRGVLLASANPAKYLKDDKVVDIKAGTLFKNYIVEKVDGVDGCDEFECYPNRDSTPYKEIYGLEHIHTIQRGTFRYKGWCDLVQKLSDLGFLSLETDDALAGQTLRAITAKLSEAAADADSDVVRTATAAKLGLANDDRIIEAMSWSGLFGDEVVAAGVNTLLDVLCGQLLPRMQYQDGQRDMLLMKHRYVVEFDDRFEHLSTTMVDYGLPDGDSSMSRTVSLPVAICMRLVMHGAINLSPGLHIPTTPDLYTPILDELAQNNIHYLDKLEKVEKK